MALFISVTLPYPYHPTAPWAHPIQGSSTTTTTTATNNLRFPSSKIFIRAGQGEKFLDS